MKIQIIAISLAAMCIMSPAALATNGGCPTGMEGATPFEPIREQKGIVDVHLDREMPLSAETIAAQGWRYRARTIALARSWKVRS
jgi:hypothetical protein